MHDAHGAGPGPGDGSRATAAYGPQRWQGLAHAYAVSFAGLCAGAVPMLLRQLGVEASTASGVHLLDVGTGPGTLAGYAAGLGARVTAIDPDPDMIELAYDVLAAHPDARVMAGSAPVLPVQDGDYDAVAANFVLNTVADPAAAAADLVRVARPGGRVAVTVWPAAAGVLQRLWQEVAERGGVVVDPVPPPPGGDFERTPGGLARLLTGAGLHAVTAEQIGWRFRIHPEQLWLGISSGITALGRVYRAQRVDVQDLLRRGYDQAVVPLLTDGLIDVPVHAVLGGGNR